MPAATQSKKGTTQLAVVFLKDPKGPLQIRNLQPEHLTLLRSATTHGIDYELRKDEELSKRDPSAVLLLTTDKVSPNFWFESFLRGECSIFLTPREITELSPSNREKCLQALEMHTIGLGVLQ